ncbi:MAG: hypothetical protein V4611_00455 [Patescibacteria group bacterium]
MPRNSKKQVQPKNLVAKIKAKINSYLSRRPHRSFRLTSHRDSVRPLSLPGYFAFNNHVTKTLWANKKIFIWLGVIYATLYAILIGIGSQETYQSLSDLMKEAGDEIVGGDFTQVGQAGLIFMVAATTGLSATLTEAQQIYAVLLALLVWLTTVWLLRNRMAGHKVLLRDGLYNAGTPIVSMALVVGLLAIQMIPIGIAALGYNLANTAGVLDGGVATMLFWMAAALLAVLSLYWATSTLFALIIVTLPGVYPFKAVRTAGDLVLGRRIKILLRWVWMLLTVVAVWAVVLIPIILIDMWLKTILPALSWLPLVPVVVLLLSTFATLWISAYVYLLYRKVVDDHSN